MVWLLDRSGNNRTLQEALCSGYTQAKEQSRMDRIHLRIIVAEFDGIANLVGSDGDHIIDQSAADTKGFTANSLYGGTIGKQTNAVEGNDLSAFERFGHARGILGFDTNNLDCRTDPFDVRGNTGEHATTTAANENGVERPAYTLFENLHPCTGYGRVCTYTYVSICVFVCVFVESKKTLNQKRKYDSSSTAMSVLWQLLIMTDPNKTTFMIPSIPCRSCQ